ncbi:MAG: replicative DNA helicase [Candidatus Riflebacteria bacterium]|nr:replicative DNA helicase [Candidatus Riflebacteria bacterium]
MEPYTKVPPYNLEAEQSLLGAMLLSEDAIGKAAEMLESEDFYQVGNRYVFAALIDLFREQRPADTVTVADVLRNRNQLTETGGAAYLANLLTITPSPSNAEYYAKIIKEKSLLRRLIAISGDINRAAYDAQSEPEKLLDEAEQKILQLSQFRISNPYTRVGDLVQDVFNRLAHIAEHKQTVTGVPSGFYKLDEYTAGFQPSDLAIVAARPSMGKTAFCLNISMFAAHACNVPVLIFSLEMSKQQIVQRLICSEGRIDGQKLRRGFLGKEDWAKIALVAGALGNTPIFIDDTPSISLLELRSKARRAFMQEKIGLIVIDYLQLIVGPQKGQDNRQQEVSAISRGLKGLARELNIPVICLSQLSRGVETRTDKRPILADLRESGAIEQDADIVLFLYRDQYYNQKDQTNKNKAEVIIAKHRNGPIGTAELAFFSEIAKFDNLETTMAREEPYNA